MFTKPETAVASQHAFCREKQRSRPARASVASSSGEAKPDAKPDALKASVARNPFHMPADKEVLLRQEDARRAAAEEQRGRQAAPPGQQPTITSRIRTAVLREPGTLNSRRFARREVPRDEETAAWVATAAARQPSGRRQEKENMAAFLAKKREIFLLQMGLDTKRAEMAKLEERARQRGAALAQSEAMLEEDAARFNTFLKENDERVQAALRKADAEARGKQEKATEIKRATAALSAVKSELAKLEEQLGECSRCGAFLHRLTPPEWFADLAAARAAAWQEEVASWEAACKALRQQQADAREAEGAARAALASAQTQQAAERANAALRSSSAALRDALAAQDPPRPAELRPQEPSDLQDAMFFQEPRQLLEVFVQAEETNLFLIQAAQEAEEGLEGASAALAAARRRLGDEAAGLQAQVMALEATLARQGNESHNIQEDAAAPAGVQGASAAAVPLEALAARIAAVWARCGGAGDAGVAARSSPLALLAGLEARVEEVVAAAASLPADAVAAVERARERERRQVARAGKLAAQREEHEARVRRALERAAAPVFKKVGKPVMARSRQAGPRRVAAAVVKSDTDAELEAFLARADLL
ncbi:hypothetical protein WJX81_001291 [Elliptochloris bilobata]|uniref:DUF4200 domain-containing protein n=1 Tax=Elliptochloris bilobata TaxID=381761 RepID=A0AAW1SBP5_9CHLO